MENNPEQKSYKPLIVILSIACVPLICVVGFLLIYPFYTDNSTEETQATEVTEEKFATDIKFEYFDTPTAFVEYIEDCVGFDFLLDGHNSEIALRPITEDYYFVSPSEHEKIASYVCHVSVEMTEKEIEELENQLAEDERFVETLGDLKILIDSPGGTNLYEYKMVYNMDTKEYNTMPEKAGEYSLITVFYDAGFHEFTIKRFNNKYWKLEQNARQ